jgi:hypothetical protein
MYRFDPEDLSLLGAVYDRLLASLPLNMQTAFNQVEIAKRLISATSDGARDPTELELAAAMNPIPDIGMATWFTPFWAVACDAYESAGLPQWPVDAETHDERSIAWRR